jgi:hypothetical protein
MDELSAMRQKETRLKSLLKSLAICLVLWSILGMSYVLSGRINEAGPNGLLALGVIAITATLIWWSLVQREGGFAIDITQPLSLYGMFYFLYYLLPYTLLFYLGLIPSENELTISLLLLIGYAACYLGLRISRVRKVNKVSFAWVEKRDGLVLFALCLGAICLIGYVYVWRDAEGIFYNQARFYEQDVTTASSLRDVFGMSLQMPVLLCLALLSAVKDQFVSKWSRRLFAVYALGIFALMILSSQTRLAITVLVFVVIGIKLYRPTFVVKLVHVLILAGVGICALLLIQGVRVSITDEFLSADSQFSYAVENTISQGYAGVNKSTETISTNVTHRSGAGVAFLSEIVDATDSRYLYGRGVVTILPSSVPRYLWPDKPVQTAPQIEYERLLGMEIKDAPLTPINQFYAEGGLFGVVVGYLVFGWLLGKFSNIAFKSKRIGVLLAFFFVWSSIVQIESEQIVGTIVTLRNWIVVYVAYLVLRIVWEPGAARRIIQAKSISHART